MKINSIGFKKWIFKNFQADEKLSTTKKIKRSLISLVIGLAIGMLCISFTGNNPFKIFIDTFISVFSDEFNMKKSIVDLTLMGLSGISAIIAFRSGFFNIGIAGQMMLGGGTALWLAILMDQAVPRGVGQILIILIAIIVGGLFSLLAAALKSWFKISEIVSTILLNWIAFFFVKWIFSTNNLDLLDISRTSSKAVGDNFAMRINGDPTFVLLGIFLVVVVLTWFIIYKTKFGYEQKLVGESVTSSMYSGLKVKKNIMICSFISGGVAGLLGVFLYFGQNISYTIPTSDTVPTIGFDGIAIALIAFNNPLGMFFVGWLFAILQTGMATIQLSIPEITPYFVNFVLGAIMILASVSIIFQNYKINRFYWFLRYGKKSLVIFQEYEDEKRRIKQLLFQKYDQKIRKKEIDDQYIIKFKEKYKNLLQENKIKFINIAQDLKGGK